MSKVTRRDVLRLAGALAGMSSLSALAACTQGGTSSMPAAPEAPVPDGTKRTVRILATSDLHGKFVPWNYPLDEEDRTGSVAQVATAIAKLRDEATLLVDAGDSIQDNMGELFLHDEIHPMMACLNELGYDIWVTGNHEYNFGMDVVRNTVKSFAGTALVGNVWDERGEPLAPSHTIVEVNGIRIGVIGMVTPNILRWDGVNLADCMVTSPVVEARKAIDEIGKDVDLLLGVMHMGLDNEFGVAGTGVIDLVNACPEFDAVVASHTHVLNEGEYVNDVLVVENEYQGRTLANVLVTLERQGDAWKVVERSSEPALMKNYEPDAHIVKLMAPYDERAKAYAREEIGILTGGPLAPPAEMAGIPTAVLQDVASIDLVNEVQLYYSGADISATAPTTLSANMQPGSIRRSDISLLYKFTNTLYTLRLTGEQLRACLEWSAKGYRQYQPGDLTLGFIPERMVYEYYQFAGVFYTLDVSAPEGERIRNLTKADGSPVAPSDSFVLATNNYFATSYLLSYGTIFDEGEELPKLLEVDLHGDIGGIRELITDYIENVKGGNITPDFDNNWKLVGNDWDEARHAEAVALLDEGTLSIDIDTKYDSILPSQVITEADIADAHSRHAATRDPSTPLAFGSLRSG